MANREPASVRLFARFTQKCDRLFVALSLQKMQKSRICAGGQSGYLHFEFTVGRLDRLEVCLGITIAQSVI